MAERELTTERQFNFQSVKLFKTDILGTGSYGAVCKAKCDQLLCAAKLLYPVLFQMEAHANKEHMQPHLRFETECRFLSLINHPNIIQYLGTYRDPKTNAPVLLMELMDESMTHFLESTPGDIPYHIQVNFSYDIAQALAFLHSNGIIHRDLSSNNVLLAGNRAKVSDFGMSRFTTTHMTKCPGTPAYMSPEALSEPPLYTERLDSFSFGVLIVQIATRLPPSPTNRFKLIELPNSQKLSQKVIAQVPISEVQRRHDHIDLIGTTHPLLHIALDCLQDHETDRPTSQEMCQALSDIKQSISCKQILQTSISPVVDDIIIQLQQKIKEKEMKIKKKDRLLQTKDDLLKVLKMEMLALAKEMQEVDIKLRTTEEKLQAISNQLQAQDVELQARNEELQAMYVNLQATKVELQNKDDLIAEKEAEILELTIRLGDLEAKCTNQEAPGLPIKKKNRSIITAKLETKVAIAKKIPSEETPSVKTQTHSVATAQQSTHHKQILIPPKPYASRTLAAKKKLSLTWKLLPDALYSISAGSSAVLGNRAYFMSRSSNAVFKFDYKSKTWSEMPQIPVSDVAIVSVARFLTSVGGWCSDSESNKLYSFIDGNWTEYFPPMPTKRRHPAAVCANTFLIVAGGTLEATDLLTVEVFNTRTHHWSVVCSLPFPMGQPSCVVFKDCVYIADGDRVAKKERQSIICSSISTLASSLPCHFVWERIPKLPLCQSTLATLDGHLFAFGGWSSENSAASDVYRLNKAINLWDFVGHMSTGRCNCLTATLPGERVMVVGSCVGKESTLAEIAHL